MRAPDWEDTASSDATTGTQTRCRLAATVAQAAAAAGSAAAVAVSAHLAASPADQRSPGIAVSTNLFYLLLLVI